MGRGKVRNKTSNAGTAQRLAAFNVKKRLNAAFRILASKLKSKIPPAFEFMSLIGTLGRWVFAHPDTAEDIPSSTADTPIAAGKDRYAGLTKEEKMRASIVSGFSSSQMQLSKYIVHEVVGFGANGCVLVGVDMSGVSVAIKIIYKGSVRAGDEISAMRAVCTASEYLVQYVEHWEDESHWYLVTDVCGSAHPSVSVDELQPLRFRSDSNGVVRTLRVANGANDLFAWSYAVRSRMFEETGRARIPAEHVKQIVRQISQALLAMKGRGYSHNDIKLENIVVSQGGPVENVWPSPSIRLVDFGHAKPIADIRKYGTKLVSSPEFLPDSPFADQPKDGSAADVFALGLVLYVLLNDDGGLPAACESMQKDTVGFFDLVSADHGRFPFDALDGVEGDALHLLHEMCRVNPVRRYTLEQILAHDWFKLCK
ncbi:hypothetical protein CcCBS67573_g07538 [Chytriomyces confervae]|uniref:Protein kinase domain-containing protein n=1 Tax=Chytriomyces confervae TaxID=246404 RepID=A0A507EVV3_9FUNG|nr:hypothetical protein CcCBS67573_g07538 [Chytriomyces confervae]